MYNLKRGNAVLHTVEAAPSWSNTYQGWLLENNVLLFDPEKEIIIDPPLPPPLSSQAIATLQVAYVTALEAFYDQHAQQRQYDTRFTCALRAGYPGPFQAEGQAFAVWMDTCNLIAYGVLAQVVDGAVAQPTIDELLDMMPALVWPPVVIA